MAESILNGKRILAVDDEPDVLGSSGGGNSGSRTEM